MKTDKRQHNNRILWTCPVCGSKYRIPAGNDPDLCPQCQELSPTPIIPPIITGVAVPPVFRRRRRVVPLWLWIGLGLFAAGTIALAVVMFWPGARESIAQSVADHKTRNAVRAYLKENMNDPKFEEVRWWPAVEQREIYRRKLEKARLANMNLEPLEKKLRDAMQNPPITLIRLKARGRNGLGAMVLQDMVFFVQRGKIIGVRKATGYKFEFPD